MSLYGMMRTGVSGMGAQASRLSTVADNIANSGTTGYKRSKTEFASLVVPSTKGAYNSGGVTTTVQTSISQQGVLQYTTSKSDLAVDGDGFFIVQDASGQPVLTRAGAFVPDDQGNLVNAAGYTLMGYSYANGAPTTTANGFAGLEPINVDQNETIASPSQNGYLISNLPEMSAPVAAADLPSANAATATYSAKTSLLAYDNVGGQQMLDVYFTKTADNTWEMAVYDRADASADTGFPYASGPLATQTLTFDPSNGKLDAASATGIDIPVPDGATLTLDLSDTTELARGFNVSDAKADGNAPNAIDSVDIANDGTVFAQYQDGSYRALYRVPLANVTSPDHLNTIAGNAYSQSSESGDVHIGFAGEPGFGKVVSGALESSNVDIAEELTNMIESQRTYTANSKVFQTGSELMDVLVNLQR